MSESVSRRRCPECGLDYFPKGKGHGCPHCLLRLAMPGAEAGAGSAERPPAGLKSRFFGDYEILEEIARGGMGVVYKARQLSLNREVALKMIQAGHLLSTEARLRFRVEIEAVAQLNHPNIVSLYESDEHEGIHYFTMRLVEGGNLSERLEENRPIREHVALLVKVCRTVHYAHQRGILHRDLKPSNILLDHQGEPHVADFGLAKSLDHETGFTYSSSILGSPNYMAPEQASSHSGPVSTAVDVYGLGAILYQVLTGRAPFQGKTALETIRQVVDSPPIPPRKLNPQVDADLATICLKCLEKKPSDRYDSAEDLATDLEQWLGGLPISARPVGTIGTLWRWSRRHPGVAALSAALVLALIGLAVGAPIAAMRIRTAERRAVAHLRDSLLDQARTLRYSGQMGMRSEGLRLVRQAAALGGPPEFLDRARDEMIAALVLTDMEFSPQAKVSTSDPNLSLLDPGLERIATIVDRTNLVVRRIADGAEQIRVAVGQAPVLRIEAFSPDGRYVALRDVAGISFWDTTQGRLCFATNGARRVFCFGAENSEVFLEEWDHVISVRALPSFRERRRIEAEPNPPGIRAEGWTFLSLAPDGTFLAGVRPHDNTLELIEVRTGRTRWRMPLSNPVTAITWQLPRRRLVIATTDGSVQFRRFEDGAANLWIRTQGPAHSLALDPSNLWLAIAHDDRFVRLWHLLSIRQIFQIQSDANRLVFDEDGTRLSSVQRLDQVGWLDLSRSSEFHEVIVTRSSSEVERCEFSADGQIVAGGIANQIDLRRVADGQPLVELPVGGIPVFAFDPLGEGIVTSSSRGVTHWAMREQRPGLTELHPSRMIVEGPRWRSVAFSADGQRFFAANAASNAVYVFPRPFTQCIASFGAHEGVESLAAAPDGRFAATGSPRDRHVRIWDVSSGQEVHATAAGRASGLAFSPDNRWLLIHRDTLDLREIGTWQPSPPLPFAGGQMITGAGCFSRDGRLLAIVVNQIEVHLFDLKNWKTIGRLRGQIETPMNGLAFSPDGRHLCAASARGRLRIWDLAEIRNRLAESDLDWDLPPLDSSRAPDSAPLELIRVPAPAAE